MGCVEVPSYLDEPEAYVPRESEAEGEDDWPPKSREAAIEYAREVRLEEGGLPIDDATLERVADVIMDPPYPEAGLLCLTAEELADDERMEEGRSVPWGVLYDGAEEPADDERVEEARSVPFGAVYDATEGLAG